MPNPLKLPKLMALAYCAATERHRESQRYANEPRLNAYLSSAFLPLWGGRKFRDQECQADRITMSLPGGRARGERIYCNMMTSVLLDAVEGRPLRAPCGSRWAPTQQDLDNLNDLGHGSRQRLLGLGVAAALLAHRVKHGSFPEKLAALALNIDLSRLSWNKTENTLFVPVDRRVLGPSKGTNGNPFTTKPWRLLKEDGWHFYLGA